MRDTVLPDEAKTNPAHDTTSSAFLKGPHVPLPTNEHERIEAKQDLILRGLHLLIRTSFAPNEPSASMRHFQGLQRDIGPWLTDYADAFTPDSNPGGPTTLESNELES